MCFEEYKINQTFNMMKAQMYKILLRFKELNISCSNNENAFGCLNSYPNVKPKMDPDYYFQC